MRRTLRELYGMRGEEIFRAIRKANDDIRKAQLSRRNQNIEESNRKRSASSASLYTLVQQQEEKRMRADSTSSISDKIDHLMQSINNFPLHNQWYQYVNEPLRELAYKITQEVDWSWTKSLKGKISNSQALHLYQLFIVIKIHAILNKEDIKIQQMLPTEIIDEMWKQHIYRTNSYLQMHEIIYGSQWRENILQRKEDSDPISMLDINQMEEGFAYLYQQMQLSFPQSFQLQPRSASTSPQLSAASSPAHSVHERKVDHGDAALERQQPPNVLATIMGHCISQCRTL